MLLKKKNITVDLKPRCDEDFNSGFTEWTFKTKDIALAYLKTNSSSIGEILANGEVIVESDQCAEEFNELVSEIISNHESLVLDNEDTDDDVISLKDFINDSFEEDRTITIFNTDFAIIIMSWMLSNHVQYEIKAAGNPIWIYHDLQHAKNDVIGNTLYVNYNSELNAIAKGWDDLYKAGLGYYFNIEIYRKLRIEFKDRFNETLIVPKLHNYFDEYYGIVLDYE